MKAEDLERYYQLRAKRDAAAQEVIKLDKELADFTARFLISDKKESGERKGGLTDGDEEALRAAQGLDSEFSVNDLATALEVSPAAVYQRLVRLKDLGALVPTKRRGMYKLGK